MLQVAYVGDVTDIAYLVSQMLEVAEQDIECDGGTCVTQMGIAVHGGAAHVHAYVGRVYRFKQLFLSCESVVDAQFVFHNSCYNVFSISWRRCSTACSSGIFFSMHSLPR